MSKKIGETLKSFGELTDEEKSTWQKAWDSITYKSTDRYHLDHSIMGFSEDFLIKLREVMSEGHINPSDILEALEKLVHEKANK